LIPAGWSVEGRAIMSAATMIMIADQAGDAFIVGV
jgi:hypothetical protein